MRFSFYATLAATALTLAEAITLKEYDETLAELDSFLPLDAGTSLSQADSLDVDEDD